LDQLQLFRLEKLLGYALGIGLRAQAQIPQLFTKFGGILVKEASELDLQKFDIRLQKSMSGAYWPGGSQGTHEARTLKEVEAKLDNDVVFTPKDIGNFTCDPSYRTD